MDLGLSPAEMEQFKEALLSAFPFKADLEQLVFFRIGEHLDQLVGGGPYGNVVTNLIIWANGQGKIDILLTQARKVNPGNPQLRKFEEQIRRNHSPKAAPGQTPSPLTPSLRTQLINTLLTLPVAGSYAGRGTFLNGISGSLNRDSGNAYVDLDMIVSQLDTLGQQTSGQWPLLVLIDNALQHAQGFKQPEEDLKRVRQALVTAYEEM